MIQSEIVEIGESNGTTLYVNINNILALRILPNNNRFHCRGYAEISQGSGWILISLEAGENIKRLLGQSKE